MQNKYNVQPRYDQKSVRELKKKNAHHQVLSPNKEDDAMWIHQSAWFHLVDFEESTETEYEIKKEGNNVYIFVIVGEFEVDDHRLKKRDALGFEIPKTYLLSQNPTQKPYWLKYLYY